MPSIAPLWNANGNQRMLSMFPDRTLRASQSVNHPRAWRAKQNWTPICLVWEAATETWVWLLFCEGCTIIWLPHFFFPQLQRRYKARTRGSSVNDSANIWRSEVTDSSEFCRVALEDMFMRHKKARSVNAHTLFHLSPSYLWPGNVFRANIQFYS